MKNMKKNVQLISLIFYCLTLINESLFLPPSLRFSPHIHIYTLVCVCLGMRVYLLADHMHLTKCFPLILVSP